MTARSTYSRWDGTQTGFDLEASDLFDEMSDDLLQNAQSWSSITHRDVTEILTDALKIILTPVYSVPALEQPVATLSNDDVLVLTTIQMDKSQATHLNSLLDMQQAGTLREEDHLSLVALMQIYNQLWIRQSEALAEAVRRGIHPPLR